MSDPTDAAAAGGEGSASDEAQSAEAGAQRRPEPTEGEAGAQRRPEPTEGEAGAQRRPEPTEAVAPAAERGLRVTQTRSAIGSKPKQRGTLRALGLGRIGKSNTLPDRPEIRGQIAKVPHLVTVEEVSS
jgi:large subunit ribosomal protein L30